MPENENTINHAGLVQMAENEVVMTHTYSDVPRKVG